ncbi:MAG: DUF1987 domain-containing protein [Salinivirgaceae bacterium]|jgi:hypothetical protein|nr:DUF1987 domain-containing protein [Salinivirgaceae bacterium]
MFPLVLDKTEDTPEIILDKTGKQFSFSGNSIPEHTKKFYHPVFDWIEKYVTDPNEETIVNFKMTYFNTSSTKSILDIMIEFKNLAKSGKMLIINWYFPEEDEDMLEAGEGFSKMVRYPFNFIKV